MGFKPETMTNKILPALGYNGPKDQKSINAFLAANPAAAAKMGKYTMAARQMVEGKVVNAYKGNYSAQQAARDMSRMGIKNLSGSAAPIPARKGGTAAQQAAHKALSIANHQKFLQQQAYSADSRNDPKPPPQASPTINFNQPNPVYVPGAGNTPVSPTVPGVSTVNNEVVPANPANMMPSGSLLSQQIGNDPNMMVTRAGVVAKDGGPATLIPQGTGQAGPAAQAAVTTAPQAATAEEIAAMTPAQYQAYQSQQALQSALQNYLAAQGQLSPDSIVDPAQMNPFTAAALSLQAAQQGQAQTVQAPTPLQVDPAQLVSGTAVDQAQVDATIAKNQACLLYTSPSPRDVEESRMPSSA